MDNDNTQPTARPNNLVMIIDDEPMVLKATARVIQRRFPSTDTKTFSSPLDFLEAIGREQPDLVLSDYDLNNRLNGIDVLKAVQEKYGDRVTRALYSSYPRDTIQMPLGLVHAFLMKPYTFEELEAALDPFLKKG